MNTLPRAITAQVLGDSDSFHHLRQHWSGLVRSPRKHALTGAHHLLYLALIGKDWRRGFTPMTSRRKLENGNFYGWKFFQANAMLHSESRQDDLLAPFDGLVTEAMLHKIRLMVPGLNRYACKLEGFAGGIFPIDAYQPLPETEPSGPEAEGPNA